MNRRIWATLIGLAVGFCGLSLVAQTEVAGPLKKTSRFCLERAVGNEDPALPMAVAKQLGASQIRAAVYHGSRVERLVALDAAEYTADRFDLAPVLAALMGAADRQVASMAARALYRIVVAAIGRPDGLNVLVPGQAAQLMEQLEEISADVRLDVDIRSIAIRLIAVSAVIAGKETEAIGGTLMTDQESIIRRQGLSLLPLPLSDGAVLKVATMATNDADLVTRGTAAALLCENALAHQVKTPSEDLVSLLTATLQTPKMPIDGFGGILACLSQFDTEEQRLLVDLAIKHPDPAVKQYWKSLQSK